MKYKSVEEVDKLSLQDLEQYMEEVEAYVSGQWVYEKENKNVHVEEMTIEELTNYVGMFDHAAYVANKLLEKRKGEMIWYM